MEGVSSSKTPPGRGTRGPGLGEAPSVGTAKHTWAASVEAAGTVSGTDDEGTDVPGTTTEVEDDAKGAILALPARSS